MVHGIETLSFFVPLKQGEVHNPQTNKIICPDCGLEIVQPEGLMIGDIVECGDCGTEVEILSLEPLQYRELIEEK